MSRPSFNLVDEPWISVRLKSGESDLVSLRDLFRRSADIRRIAGELPTQDFAVLRIALAVMYRALGGDEDVDETWNSGTLPLDAIHAYLDRWHDRFDLFDEVHPFMQVAELRSAAKEDSKPLTLLVPDCPGDGSLFTMRRTVPELTFAESARWLVHCQAYDFAGLKTGSVGDSRNNKNNTGGPPGIGWAGWLGGLYLDGRDLRETLIHNWVPSDDLDQRHADRALWELEPLTPVARSQAEIGPFGPAGLFTWPIRHIRLFTEDDRVTRVLICIGDPIAKAYQQTIEPMTSWRYSEQQTKKEKSQSPLYMPRTHDPTRALWRGLAPLLPAPKEKKDSKDVVLSYPSAIVKRLGTRFANDLIPNHLVGMVSVGVEYGPQMSTYSQMFSDSLVLHPAVADAEGPARRCVIDAVLRADEAVSALARLAGDLAVADGGERREAADRARATAYAALDQHFRAWIRHVDNRPDTEDLSQAWFGLARDVISGVANDLLDSATPRSRAVRIVDGRPVSAGSSANWFRHNLYKHLPDTRKDEAI